MRLARYETHEGERIGVVRSGADRVVDVDLLDDRFGGDVVSILEAGSEAWARLHELARDAPARPFADVRFLAPVRHPGKYLAIGMNSHDHARELMDAPRSPELVAVLQSTELLQKAFPAPRFPTLFNKQTNAIQDPYGPIWMPRDSDRLDYEGEVAMVIGRRVRRVDPAEAAQAIAGYVVTNDVSVRDWQWDTSQMWLGKSFDTHGPIGPWIVTADEFNLGEATIRTWVNEDLRQEGRLTDQILSPAEIVSIISQVCSLAPGDLIATGTPGGIGGTHGRYLAIGDLVRVGVEGIGEICNEVVAEPGAAEPRETAVALSLT